MKEKKQESMVTTSAEHYADSNVRNEKKDLEGESTVKIPMNGTTNSLSKQKTLTYVQFTHISYTHNL